MMKKLYTLLIALFFVGGTMGQADGPCESCLPNGIQFKYQAEIDNFQNNYPGCTQIEGNVLIGDSYLGIINNLDSLNVLTYIGGDLIIGNGWEPFHELTDLTGLNGLDSIGGSLFITRTGSITSLSGLENLISIGGDLRIEYTHLSSLSGLDNISSESIENIYLSNNDELSSCEAMWLCDYLASPNGSINIFDNASGCNDPSEIANNCGTTLGCLPFGNYYFNTQALIDDFSINYPDCSELQGNVTIDNSSITSLDGLIQITTIGGHLNLVNNYHLTQLSGLDSLRSIGSDLLIQSNNTLKNLSGLGSLDFIGSKLIIKDNDSLANLTGLENLDTIFGYVQIGGWYSGNPSLINLTGLDNLTAIEGSLDITENISLVSMAGLESLSEIGGTLSIARSSSLSNLSKLNNISSIGGDLKITGNGILTNLEGLENLASTGGILQIEGNPALTSLTGLEGLTSIGGHLIVRGNNFLDNITGLYNLNTINGSIFIGVDDYLGNYGNEILSNLSGLDNIDSNSIEGLYIAFNPTLSTCEVQSICDYLVSPNANVSIHDNSTGCNSQEEVEEACESTSISEVNNLPELSIYPNPSNSTITIELPTQPSKNTTLTISSTNGQNLITQAISKPQTEIDIGHLPSGIYIVKVWNDQDVMVQKVIKH